MILSFCLKIKYLNFLKNFNLKLYKFSFESRIFEFLKILNYFIDSLTFFKFFPCFSFLILNFLIEVVFHF